MTNYLLAGGGTAGHVNPLLSLAEEIRRREPAAAVLALGTREGLESRLVPDRGFELLFVERLPFPRKLNFYAIGFPGRWLSAVGQLKTELRERKIDVVVGFGGYASAPAYAAARSLGIPIVVHEANARAGFANRFGARFAAAVGVAFASCELKNAKLVGMPLRREIEELAAKGTDADSQVLARKHFDLEPDAVTLLVTGGSLGAKRLNETIERSRTALLAAGIQVLHIVGERSEFAPEKSKGFVRLAYCERMDLAIQAANFAVSRAGASTVSEFAAIGLPAVYVPYPVGNGEQRFNAADVVSAGGGLLVDDKDFNPEYVSQFVIPVISDSRRLKKMATAAASVGVTDGASRLYNLIQGVASPNR